MSFAALLREIVDGCRGGLGAALLGYDGMPIEQVLAEAAPETLPEDLSTAGVEFGRILAEVRKASDAVAGGSLLDLTVRLSRMSFVFCGVDDDTFVAVVLAPDGNTGQARYLIRRQMSALRAEL
jgi:predicted regulator of Ras-like GTPase activity (Roadblock/LC7/MglB family)